MKKILILNGSPSGKAGNCAKLIKLIEKEMKLTKSLQTEVIHLASSKKFKVIEKKILQADGFVFLSGTYWDSWGSPLQACLEQMTSLEATSALLGKPAAVIVLMHSVGGKSVLSRLQGVLSTMGLLIPPMSGLVYSLVNQMALKTKSPHIKDLWQLQDIQMIVQNLQVACEAQIPWQAWPVDPKNPRRIWLKI